MRRSKVSIEPFQLVVFVLLTLLTIGGCGNPGGEIPMAPGANLVTKFIGTPATPNPLPEMTIPQHTYLAEQGKSGVHADSYNSGTYPWSGPLGNNPEVHSLSVEQIAGLVALSLLTVRVG